jgi:TRAP-type C4-dicarboxylate transport system substrate-binding protein
MASCVAWAAIGHADPVTLRLATLAPEGTPIGNELKSFAMQVETVTKGEVKIRWVFDAVAGDEPQAAERMERGQLDGMGSAGPLCEELSPTYRALRLIGLFRTREEAAWVAGQLRPELTAEMDQRGYVHLAEDVLGPILLFTKEPVTTLAQLKGKLIWTGVVENTQERQLAAMGVNTMRARLDEAEKAFARMDGFLSVPAGVLAFQWWKPARYVSELPVDWLTGCMVLKRSVFDRLSLERQQLLRSSAARLHQALAEKLKQQDELLLSTVLEKQGVVKVPASEAMRREVAEAARATWSEKAKVAPAAVARVEKLLASYRATHSNPHSSR